MSGLSKSVNNGEDNRISTRDLCTALTLTLERGGAPCNKGVGDVGTGGPNSRTDRTEQAGALPLALPLRSGKAEGLKLTYPIHHRAPCPVARLSSHTSQSRRGGDSPRTGVDQSHTYMRAGQRAGIHTSVKRRPAGPHPTESPRTTCLLTLVLFVEASRDLRSGCST